MTTPSDKNDEPKILYKYRTWSDKYHRRLITDNEIYFASPEDYNDPFECINHPDYSNLTKQQKIDSYEKYLRRTKPSLNREQIRSEARHWQKKQLLKNPEYLKERYEIMTKYIYNCLGVFSLSSKRDNILMWSHYAESHKGFCIGIEIDKLRTFREYNMIQGNKNVIIVHFSVDYRKETPILDPMMPDKTELARKHVSTKSIDWRYEKEHRMILLDKNREPFTQSDRKFKISGDFISKLIFGCRMPDDHKREILQILKEKDTIDRIDILQAQIVENRFELDIQKVPRDEIERLVNS